jgi:DNA-binding LacI/PurR family transcriptional regulator
MARLTTFDLDFVLGAATATDERDYVFTLVTAPLAEGPLLNLYRSKEADGVVLMQTMKDDWRIDLLRDKGLPFVSIGTTDDDHDLALVDFDLEGSVDLLLEFLAMLGHEHVAFVGRPNRQLELGVGAAVRLTGAFEAACQRLSLTGISLPAELDQTAAGHVALQMLRQHPEVSAFVTTHGSAAAGVMTALRDEGVVVPRDVSVVGLSTAFVANLMTPRLTHVPFPSYELGYQAAAMLVRRLEQRTHGRIEPSERVQLPAHLSVGASTASRLDRPGPRR